MVDIQGFSFRSHDGQLFFPNHLLPAKLSFGSREAATARSSTLSGYLDISREAFAFLESEYHFSIKACSNENGGGQITYVNVEVGVGVKALYEFSSAFVFVFIYRLVDGKLRDNVLPITDESEISCFDFNDALAADQKMKAAYEYGDDSEYFDEQNGLQNYGMVVNS